MSEFSKDRIAIILLNYNNADECLACVQRSQKIGYFSSSIIVVDNHSSDDSITKLRAHTSEYHLIESPVNGGFGYGNNIGLRYAQKLNFDFYCVMNSDILFDRDFIEPLATYLRKHNDVGIVGPSIRNIETGKVISNGGSFHFYNGKSKFDDVNTGYVDKGPIRKDYLLGGCVLVSKKSLIEAGLIPEEYFLNYEDNEWCMNFSKIGFKVVCLTSTYVFHLGGGSIDQVQGLGWYFMLRNRVVFERRNASLIQKLVFYPWLFLSIIKDLFVKDKRGSFRPYIDGLLDRNKYKYLIK